MTMWQRARIVSVYQDQSPSLIGRLIWVKVGKPTLKAKWCETPVHSDGYVTNVKNNGRCTGIPRDAVELLPEFVPEAPQIAVEEFLGEG